MHGNNFYNAFDIAMYPEPRARRPGTDERHEFQVDRDRIIFSAAFRRLQSKTQVFHSGEYDFYRTRLTHSLEVAQIGRGICQHLRHSSGFLRADFFIDPDLVEACGLAHDIGHPPFGHAGETALHECMRAHGGFEGNAQTLRILTSLIFGIDGGMKPTRALLDGVLKYKCLFSEQKAESAKFLYPEQAEIVAWVLDGGDENLRSIECQIMDWADDVAYGLMDIVDGVNANFITLDRIERWRRTQPTSDFENEILDELCTVMREGKLDRVFARRVGDCICATKLSRHENGLSVRTNRHAYALQIDEVQRTRIKFYKRLAVELIFRTPQIKQLEFKGRRILTELFRALLENYEQPSPASLLPPEIEAKVAADSAPRERILCDYLSAMTDAGVIRIYRRLFDPEFGSILDL